MTCDMEKGCTAPVTYIDNKGYVYCTAHGAMRRMYRPCRKLTTEETTTLEQGGVIAYKRQSVAPFADLPESAARDRALDRWRNQSGSILVQTCVALVALAIVSQLISTVHQYGFETLGNHVNWMARIIP